MSVRVQCPNCGKSYNVGDESLGARARCKNCNNHFTISVSLDDTGSALASGSEKEEPVANQSPQAKSSDGTSKDGTGSKRPSGKEPTKQPKKLGNFVIEKRLGAGGMGVVYLARDPVLDRKVAIKVLPASLSRDEQRLKRFLREAQLAGKLHHTHVATVHQAGSEGKLAYIAMEYVEGCSLDRAVAKGKAMDWREATQVIRDAASGLGAAHKIGLVHRDIKPGNLMRTPDGVTKVVDFGLARAQQGDTQLTQEGALLGTPSYMAPEQWKGEEVDGRTDLYSLICTYYFLVTGHLPFEAESIPALAVQHQTGEFPDPRKHIPDLPDGICRILSRGAAKVPSRRFQTAEELVEQLDVLLACPEDSLEFGSSWANLAALDLAPLPAHAGPPSVQTSQPPSTSSSGFRIPPWAWIATAAGAAALFLILGIVFTFSTKYGDVKIALHNADDSVEVTLDGDTINVDGLDEPLELKVGQYDLVASSPKFETVTRSFQVKQDETTVVDITFVPKTAEVAIEPARYEVTVEPPAAMLAASGDGVSVSGRGSRRTVTVARPDGQKSFTLVATLNGYDDYRQMLVPKAGESRDLTVRLESIEVAPMPEKPQVAEYQVTVDPPEATLTASGKGVSISGQGVRRTITIANPDSSGSVTLVAMLDGYRNLRREFRPSTRTSSDLVLRLERIDATRSKVASNTVPPPASPSDSASAKTITNSLGMKFVRIPAGEFEMGSQKSPEQLAKTFAEYRPQKKYFQGEQPLHHVRITKSYFLGVHEVTVGQFRQFCEAAPYRSEAERDGKGGWGYNARRRDLEGRTPRYTWRNVGWAQTDDHPVVNVTWRDAVAFCDWLSHKEGKLYRLPTEAEWEYACRANTTTHWHCSDDPEQATSVANVADTTMGKQRWFSDLPLRASDGHTFTSPVGSFRPNDFGQYDMHGNVWEWCFDWYSESYYSSSPTDDPTGPIEGSYRVLRGGSYAAGPCETRSARRYFYSPDDRSYHVGFRVAMTIPEPRHDERPMGELEASQPVLTPAAPVDSPPLPDGCVVAYSFDRDTIFTEGSQRYVRDLSGNDYHGLLSDVEIVDGQVEQAGKFFGDGRGYVKLPDENGQYPANDFTILTWVCPTDHGGRWFVLNYATSSIASNNGGIHFAGTRTSKTAPLQPGIDIIYAGASAEAYRANARMAFTPKSIPYDAWSHVGVTRKNGTISFIINGKIESQHRLPAGPVIYDFGSYDDNSVHIGLWKRRGGVDNPGSCKGKIDEFYLFDRALSEQEIADIYAAQAGR